MNKIYEVRQSNKGWSESYCFTFSKESAEHIVAELKDTGAKNNFKVVEHECYYPKDLHFCLHTEWNLDEDYPF